MQDKTKKTKHKNSYNILHIFNSISQVSIRNYVQIESIFPFSHK